MGCKYWQEQILAAIDRKLSSEAEAKLREHLHTCAKCAESYAWQKLVHETLHAKQAVKAPERFNEAVWQKLENVSAPSRVSFRWAPATLGALGVVAAAFALVVVSNQWFQEKTTPKAPRPPMVAEQPEVLTPEPAALEVTLLESTPERPQRAQEKASEEKVVKTVPRQSIELEPNQEIKPEAEHVEQVFRPLVVKEEPQRKKKSGEQVRPRYSYKPPRLFRKSPQDRSTESESKKMAAGSSAQEEKKDQVPTIRQVRLLKNKIHINRNEKTRLEILLAEPAQVQARVFSREGRLVKKIIDQELPAGTHVLEWDGSTESGEKTASGIYMLVISGDIEKKKFKIAVIK